jgi:methylated-DNA-[protein]-cysteine S-methyltransferase
VDSPVGPLTLWGTDGVLHGLALQDQRHRPVPDRGDNRPTEDGRAFDDAVDQLGAYFSGERRAFEIAMCLEGTEFQRTVWAALVEIPYGQTRSYGEIAAAIGRPGASRAVGLANGRNPIAIVVPCHRVIGSNGSLTGYGGGLETKRWLLDLERRHRRGHGDRGGRGHR